MGTPLHRLDGPDKVRGAARYAFEHPVDNPAYLYPVQSTIPTGRITGIDTTRAEALPGVLAVLTHDNVPRLNVTDNGELAVLQCTEISFAGQFVGGVVAETSEIARHAAGLVQVDYQARPHDVVLRADRDDLRTPKDRLPQFPMRTSRGDVDAAMASAAFTVDQTYTTPRYHHNSLEPHTTTARWTDDGLVLHLSTQSVHLVRTTLAELFGLDPDLVRVISPHVGGAFGSKVMPRADVVLAALAARRLPGRSVRFALTRQQAFTLTGYRPPTIQRVRLGADADGRLVAVGHDSVEQTSTLMDYAEQATRATVVMYAAENLAVTQRLATLDVPTPSIMRAPGEAPGMFALESAVDELAAACGMDPVEFRIRNEPAVHPTTGRPFSDRQLAACLRRGARRFGWSGRNPVPRSDLRSGWLVGTGVAACTYPALRLPGSVATIRAEPTGRFTVLIGAADLGTGTWTALTQIAADALGVAVAEVDLRIGDTAYPVASEAGGSSGLACWGSTVVAAAELLRARLASEHGGTLPAGGFEVSAGMPDNPHAQRLEMHSFGAQFAEARVDVDTGEVRVPRLLGVFSAGRIINPNTGRSQLLGAMTMGMSMALFEHGVLDPRFGRVVNQDLATYHVATNADVGSIEVHFLDGDDPYVNPMGARGIGELGIVGAAAAIANAVYHATGVRVRDLPITLDALLT
ncbi:MAG TPA: xanthine dehydrogenase family protein molybdopterin-binding subunit [Mycobacteriales bacterium]|nr:xanthine dehydrogenase family protein molybdopterin-binding subunit [Mycobacteriales bacterium]